MLADTLITEFIDHRIATHGHSSKIGGIFSYESCIEAEKKSGHGSLANNYGAHAIITTLIMIAHDT